MTGNETTKWHWTEGMKYALEGIRMLLLLNGGAAISVLTFAGNTRATSVSFVVSLGAFALGAAAAPLAMIFAYLAQLHYGNAELQSANSAERTKVWGQAALMHYFGYGAVGFSIVFFVGGIGAAAAGLLGH
jgi:hypothetical protein